MSRRTVSVAVLLSWMAFAHSAAPPARRVDAQGDALPAGVVARLGTMRLWASDDVVAVAMHPDGKLVAAATVRKGVYLWDASTGAAKSEPFGLASEFATLAFSPDGTTLAVSDGKCVEAWDVTGPVRKWQAKVDGVVRLAFAHDGKTLAAVRPEQGVRLLDGAKGGQVADVATKEACVAAAFSVDGKTLAVGHRDGEIGLWDVGRRREVGRLKGHKAHPFGLAFAPDGKVLASSSADGTLRLWNVAKRAEKTLVKTDRVWAYALWFDPAGKSLLALTHGGKLRRIDVATGKDVVVWQDAGRIITGLSFSADGKFAAFTSVGGRRRVRLLDVQRGREIVRGHGHDGAATGIEYSPDGRTVATCSVVANDPVVQLWDAASGRHVRELRGHGKTVAAIAFAPDGKSLASASADGTLRLWDVASGRSLRRFVLERGEALSVTFSPNGRTLASGSVYTLKERDRAECRLWDVESGAALHALGGAGMDVFPRRFERGGQTLLTTGDCRRVWDVQSGELLFRRDGEATIGSPDGRLEVSRDHRGLFNVVEKLTGRPLWRAPGLSADVKAARFSPDGRLLALSYGQDVLVIDVDEGRTVRQIDTDRHDPVAALAFAPDGRSLAVATASATHVWDVRGVRLIEPERVMDLEVQLARLGAAFPHVSEKAIRDLAADVRCVAYLSDHVKAVPHSRSARLLVQDLDADEFTTRQNAVAMLEELGDGAAPALHAALMDKQTSLEARKRATKLARRLEARERTEKQFRALRAVAALERAGTDAARTVLRRLAAGHPDAELTYEANAALRRLARR